MRTPYKDELNKRYGDFIVTEYTNRREPSNGCVVWKCECVYCGAISHRNGNNLRFSKNATCMNCYSKKSRNMR